MHYYHHHIGDYRKDTGHLNLLEHGVYHKLIEEYYLAEHPLPDDIKLLRRAVSARKGDEKEALDNVLADFFILTEGGYVHARCEKELERIYAKSAKARESVQKRWDKKRAKDERQIRSLYCKHTSVKDADTNVSKSDTDQILPNTQDPTPKTQERSKPCVDWFSTFWLVYPKKIGKKECRKKWKLRKLDEKGEMIVTDVRARLATDRKWINGYIPNPATYINGDRWEDEIQLVEMGQRSGAQDWLEDQGGEHAPA